MCDLPMLLIIGYFALYVVSCVYPKSLQAIVFLKKILPRLHEAGAVQDIWLLLVDVYFAAVLSGVAAEVAAWVTAGIAVACPVAAAVA